ncbi:MAG: LLM class F420-dependent oxidoreductase [Dehalococcoidia bacterium]
MRYGVNFPHAIGKDPVAIRDWAQAVEGNGFDYMLTIDHVAGVHRDQFGPDGPAFNYTSETPTHELLTLFAFVAGVTTRLELAPSVLLLPQRPTVLAAKQCAEVQILSGGRLRVVVGIGWNHVEYASLGANFHNRGRRLEEQIEVMKALWTAERVDYNGRYHKLAGINLNPLPDKAPPLWMGGGAEDKLLRRYAKYADGWLPLVVPGTDVPAAVERLRGFLAEEGRDPASFGLDVRVNIENATPEEWVASAKRWRDLGATNIAIMGAPGDRTPMENLARFTEALQVIRADVG